MIIVTRRKQHNFFFFLNFTKYLSVILKIFKMHILKIKHFKIAYPNKNIGDSSILPLFFFKFSNMSLF